MMGTRPSKQQDFCLKQAVPMAIAVVHLAVGQVIITLLAFPFFPIPLFGLMGDWVKQIWS